MEDFNQNNEIARVRQSLELSTSELAHKLGISQSSVVRLEQGERRGAITLNSLYKVAEILGCTLKYELVPRESRAKKKQKSYPGLKRMKREDSKRTPSRIGEELRADVQALATELTPEKRIEQCCSLSDLTREIRLCSKKR